MEKDNRIKCPSCGADINVSEVLYHQLEESIKKNYDKKLVQKDRDLQSKLESIQAEKDKLEQDRNSLKEQIDKEVRDKLKAEKTKVEKLLRQSIHDETSEQIADLRKELTSKTDQVKELNKTKAEVERLKREKEELSESIALEKEKEFTEKLREERSKIKKQVQDDTNLKIKEKEKIIEDLSAQLGEAQRKAEQGSTQLQGEIQELEIENMLRELYKFDDIIEVKKGVRGADILQKVKTDHGEDCGAIYYESKRTKHFDNGWLRKLREDNIEVKADILVLVTEAMPEGVESFCFREGVWICAFAEVRGLSLVLRHGLQQVRAVLVTQHGKETKAEMLYKYLTSQEFKGQFGAIIEGFKALQDNYNDEKLRMQKLWKEREKQLEKILTNTVFFYGSLRGIAGASIPEIKMLEGEQSLSLE